MDFSIELVLKARKFRAGAEVLLLEAVESTMESNLSESRHRSYERGVLKGCVQSQPREASGQCPFLAWREGHNLSIPLIMGQKLDKK